MLSHSVQGQTDQRIQKSSVMAALGIRTTMLAEAQKATQIINMFAKGPRRAQEVVDMLEKDQVDGSGPLLHFLEQWKKDHALAPVVSA
jgi:hypothetical protein